MVHRLNYYHRLLKKLYLYQLNWIAKMSAYVSERIHHSNVTHLVLGKKKFQMSAAISSAFPIFTRLFFSTFRSQASSFNCEMSDLDQSELKLNVNFAHTNDRDYWLFAWNPFDLTCRDKVATIGGSNRANNDRRMDIFREKDGKRKIYQLCT